MCLHVKIKENVSEYKGYEKKLDRKKHKNFINYNPIISDQIGEAKQKFIAETDESTLLSYTLDETKKTYFQKQFSINKERLNSMVKKNLKKEIDKTHEQSFKQISEESSDFMQGKLLKNQMSEQIIKQLEALKKQQFIQYETQRQLERQKNLAENNQDDSNLSQDQLEIKNKFVNYNYCVNELKNQRISNMLKYSGENKKLAILIESGLMDRQQNIQDILKKSLELNKNLQISDNSTNKNNNNINNNPSTQIQNQDHLTEIGVSPPQKTNQIMPYENQDKYYMELITSIGLDLTQSELKFIDFESLKSFFQEFLFSTPVERIKIMDKLKLMNEIKLYQEFLFDKYRNNDITLRRQGRLQFKDLSEIELKNYLKYNIKDNKNLFLSLLTMFRENVMTPPIVSQFIQKIASFKYESQLNILALIRNPFYRKLLRLFVNSSSKMDNDAFIDAVYSIGKLHKYELGRIYPRLFTIIQNQIKINIIERIKYLKIDDLSFLLRGIINLNTRNDKELNKVIIQKIKPYIDQYLSTDSLKGDQQKSEKSIKEQELEEEILINPNIEPIQKVYTLCGILLYLSQITIELPQIEHLLLTSLNIFKTKEIQEDFDKISLSDFCAIFSGLLQLNKSELIKQELKNIIQTFYKEKMTKQLIKQLDLEAISSLTVFCSAIQLSDKQIFQQLKKQTLKKVHEYPTFQQYTLPQIVMSYAVYDYQRQLKNFTSKFSTLSDINLVTCFFPKQLFPLNSPNYQIYSELAQLIAKEKKNISPKWLALATYATSSVEYKNYDFVEQIVDEILDIDENSDEVVKTTQLDLLSMLAFNYSLLKIQSEKLIKILDKIKNLFISEIFQKATPQTFIHYISTIANLNLDVDEPEKEFIKIAFYDKISPHNENLSDNMKINLIWSFCKLDILDPQIVYDLSEQLFIKNLEQIEIENQNSKNSTQNIYQIYLLNQIKSYLIQNNLFIDNAPEEIKVIQKQSIIRLEEEIENIVSNKQRNQRFSYFVVKNQINEILLKLDYKFQQNQFVNMQYVQFLIEDRKTNKNLILQLYSDIEFYSYNTDQKQFTTMMGLFALKNQIIQNNNQNIILLINQAEFNFVGEKEMDNDKRLSQQTKFIQERINEALAQKN